MLSQQGTIGDRGRFPVPSTPPILVLDVSKTTTFGNNDNDVGLPSGKPDFPYQEVTAAADKLLDYSILEQVHE
jgi:hypothetical protein